MLNNYTDSPATIGEEVKFRFGDPKELKIVNPSRRDTWKMVALCVTATTIARDITFPYGEGEEPKIPTHSAQDLSTSLGLRFEEEIESALTQESSDTPHKHLAFPSYDEDEEDILDWDVAIVTPPPRPSGTIRVRLKYKGRSKPFPIEDFWED